ncbi:MAG: aspartyl/asparaginyl beta-hydroxylase domain-containing protein [Planctomycetes bacterium]|nr:aspartyl/asparaginyl beta-hydroxylase domain-containing protein [Planctomycetota bacterium]MCB9889346.1 aspartyl/asparaginyl beta-hydroxylase domain-containing protein [Planctomycetota bacterium]
MLLDPAEFSFVPPLEAAFEVFRTELERVGRTAFTAWPDRGAYVGNWLGLPLFMASHHPAVGPLFAPNQQRCPATMQVLRGIPSLVAAGFSWMEPGCHILPHVDVKPPDVLRTHLGLRIPDRAVLRVGAEHFTWQEGRCLVFDGTIEHETANLSDRPRVVLLIDARLNARELDYLRDCSARG